MSSSRDWLYEMAMRKHDELERNPAYQIAKRHIEELERNPALKVALKQIEEQERNPLYQVIKRSIREFDRENQYLRNWERRLPDWILNAKRNSISGLDLALGSTKEVERIKSNLFSPGRNDTAMEALRRIGQEALRQVEARDPTMTRNWLGILNLSQEFSEMFRSLPQEMNETFLGQAVQRLESIRASTEENDQGRFEQEFDAFGNHLLNWVRSVFPDRITSDAMLGIMIALLIALAQTGISYKWRQDDQRDADSRFLTQNEKMETLLSEVLDLKQKQATGVGRPYQIERTTPVFGRPGPKQQRVGYVYAGQRARAIATTGRWIFIEYADPFNLELRAGWIRKKYAKSE